KKYRRIHFLCDKLKHRLGFRLCFTNDYWYTSFNDPRLFFSYFRKGVSKILYMIQTDVGNNAYFRNDHVRTVQPTSQTHFYDRKIHLLPGKMIKCHRHGHLKKTGTEDFNK